MARAKGSANGFQKPTKRGVILLYLKSKVWPMDDRNLRNIVRKMSQTGYRIGSNAKYGYFVIKTLKDLQLTIEERQKKQRALGQSIAWERRAFQNLTQRRLRLKTA